MNIKVDAKATYYAVGDSIVADIYVRDEDRKVFVPNLIKTGLAKLLGANGTVLACIDFDMRMGNDDGAVKLFISHPTQVHNLKLNVLVQLTDLTQQHNITVDVQQALQDVTDSGDALTPIVPQPTTQNPDFRARKRINEGI